MPQTLTNFADALKNFYTPVIREQLAESNIIYSKVTRDKESFNGSEAYMALHIGTNQGIGARGEMEDLPSPGKQSYKQVHFPLKYNYSGIMVSGQVIAQSKSNQGAYVQALRSEVQGAVNDLKSDLNRQAYGDGSGKLAAFTGTSASATQVVDDARWIKLDMLCDVIKSDGSTLTSGLTVSSFDPDTKTVVFDKEVTPTAGSFLVRSGAYNKEITGLGKIIGNTGSYLGIDRSITPYWRSYVNTAESTRAISDDLLQKCVDMMEINGGKVDLLLTTYGVRRAYQALLTQSKRYVNTMDLKGGFKALDFDGKPLVADRDMEPGTIYGVDLGHITLFSTGNELEWLDRDGSMLRKVPNKDAFEATLIHYAEFASDRPACMFKLDKITEA